MRRTVKARFFHGERRINTRERVLKEVGEIFDISELHAIYKCGEGHEWYLKFRNETIPGKIGHGNAVDGIEGMKIRFDRLDKRKVKFRVHWFPMHMNLSLVESHFETLGSNVNVCYEDQAYGTLRLQTGAISGEMVVTEDQFHEIPYRATILGNPVLITVLGRRSKCFKCGSFGHQRATCPAGGKQSSVQQRSYTGAVSGHNQEDATEVPEAEAEVVEKTTENGLPLLQRGVADVTPQAQDKRATEGSTEPPSVVLGPGEGEETAEEEMDMSGASKKRTRCDSVDGDEGTETDSTWEDMVKKNPLKGPLSNKKKVSANKDS
ncbi:unnamed protein product [Mytilus edulis]|uniref:CCHC-type domain-containing protein n=1 Tax=Mytilus edulis TaxID=6550 RepID=A0A8S3SH02_MYTED|nr:unnamed protein product [Mytilus edulis]